jgi:hypothetical protein
MGNLSLYGNWEYGAEAIPIKLEHFEYGIGGTPINDLTDASYSLFTSAPQGSDGVIDWKVKDSAGGDVPLSPDFYNQVYQHLGDDEYPHGWLPKLLHNQITLVADVCAKADLELPHFSQCVHPRASVSADIVIIDSQMETIEWKRTDAETKEAPKPINQGHCCPVKSRRESVGWHFRRNWPPGRWSEVRIKWAFSRKA